jgi:hypothetical protein
MRLPALSTIRMPTLRAQCTMRCCSGCTKTVERQGGLPACGSVTRQEIVGDVKILRRKRGVTA